MQNNHDKCGKRLDNMVGSISAIGSYSTDIFQSLTSTDSSKTTAGMSFEDMISNGIISNTDNEKVSTGITAAGGEAKAESADTSGSKNEMDLNNDGQVTIDEVIRYMQMQMADNMSEQMSSEDGSFEMGQQAQQNTGIEEFKSKQAANAYQAGRQLMDTAVDMITDSFMFLV